MKTEKTNPFETFLSVCRMQSMSGHMTSDVPLIYVHGGGPGDTYAVYQEWDETDNPTVWNAQLKVASAHTATEILNRTFLNIIEMPSMNIDEIPDTAEGREVRKRIEGLGLHHPRTATDSADELTPCLILSGGHEFGTQSYPGKVKFHRDPKDSIEVLIPNGMKWNAAVGNLKALLEDLEFWINTRTNTTIGELDMITEREPNSPFPPF